MCHSQVLFIHRENHWIHWIKLHSIIEPTVCAQIRIKHKLLLFIEEQKGRTINKSHMEQDRTGEYHHPKYLVVTLEHHTTKKHLHQISPRCLTHYSIGHRGQLNTDYHQTTYPSSPQSTYDITTDYTNPTDIHQL